MSVEDSESHRFEPLIWLSVSEGDLAQHLPENIWGGVVKVCYFVNICAHSDGTEILWRVSSKFKPFFGQHRAPLSLGLRRDQPKQVLLIGGMYA